MPSAAQPTAGQKGARRRPKCHGFGLRVKEANSTAVPMKMRLCISVAMIVKVGSSSSVAGAGGGGHHADRDQRPDQRHEEADARVPGRPARRDALRQLRRLRRLGGWTTDCCMGTSE